MAKEDIHSIMFVDMVGSTAMKHRLVHTDEIRASDIFFRTITTLWGAIDDACRVPLKFTGDGAMAVFDEASAAIVAAEKILQIVDAANVGIGKGMDAEPIHLHIGIATGAIQKVTTFSTPDYVGRSIDLAARLCGECPSDRILVDAATHTAAGAHLPRRNFADCTDRLNLKGIPPEKSEAYYFFTPRRLLTKPTHDPKHSNGLLALFPSRLQLGKEFFPARWLWFAAPGTKILVAGRTLLHWTENAQELLHMAEERNLKFQFLIGKKNTFRFLPTAQVEDTERHYENARQHFERLAETYPERFDIRESPFLLLDGIVSAEVNFPGSQKGPRLLTLQDVNAATGEKKAAMLWSCTCSNPDQTACVAHGLRERTQKIFDEASPIPVSTFAPASDLVKLLNCHRHGLTDRNNSPGQYLRAVQQVFAHLQNPGSFALPPPISVQLQVGASCSTQCVMCDKWEDNRRERLGVDDWIRAINDVATQGVKSVVLSGGEPLALEGIEKILEALSDKGIAIGVLTSGVLRRQGQHDVLSALEKHANWVSVSIDGLTDSEGAIRRGPSNEERFSSIRSLVRTLGPRTRVSATVTLQKLNIDTDFGPLCEFIHGDLGIPQINFKFATGFEKALENKERDFWPSAKQISDFEEYLWTQPLADKYGGSPIGNNLKYLRQTLASRTFSAADIASGAPVRGFYKNTSLRCFAPYIHSLIDADGSIYSCCHLFRDNHGRDRTAGIARKNNVLGTLAPDGRGFAKVWQGERYNRLRMERQHIDPDDPSYLPCGECTRFFRHNHFLTEAWQLYQRSPQDFASLDPDQSRPVWF